MNVQQLQRLLVDDVTLDDLVLAKGLLTGVRPRVSRIRCRNS